MEFLATVLRSFTDREPLGVLGSHGHSWNFEMLQRLSNPTGQSDLGTREPWPNLVL